MRIEASDEAWDLLKPYKREASVASCEELRELIEEGRMLLQHIRDVTSEPARCVHVSLNRDLLFLWKEYFTRCPKMAREYLRKCESSSSIPS